MSGKKNKDIMLADLLKEKLINLELEGKDKKEIIYNLVELIATSKRLKNKKVFFKTMLERERLGSTGIGGGIAIPHAKSKAVAGFILVFARIIGGMDFGALDGEKTYLFFALASPEEEVGGHLKILAEISRLVKDKFIVEKLKKVKDAKEVLKIISLYAR
jgi:fructose-specific phosphotransferase system IIA component